MAREKKKAKRAATGEKGTPRQKANPSGAKVPTKGTEPVASKTPRIAASPIESETLVWRFTRMDLDGQWSWTALTPKHARDVHGKCCQFETMRASELFGSGGNKLIPIERLCGDAQKRLREIDADDLDGLWELRLGGKPRIWGARSEHAFDLIWWDPEHTVCPSQLRNT